MAGHPDIVPSQHHDRYDQDRCVEDLLPYAFERLPDCSCERRDQARPDQPRDYAQADEQAAAGDSLGDGQDDADDEACLDDFAKYDDQRAQHARSLPLNS
jgi:hypothetical protein